MFKKLSNLFKSTKQKKEDLIADKNKEILSSFSIAESDFIYRMEYEISTGAFGINRNDIPFRIKKQIIPSNQLVLKGEPIIRYALNGEDNGFFNKIAHENAEISGTLIHLREINETINEGEFVYSIKPQNVTKEDINERIITSRVIHSQISFQDELRKVVDIEFNSGQNVQLIINKDDFKGESIETTPTTLKSKSTSENFKLVLIKQNSKIHLRIVGYRKLFPLKPLNEFHILKEDKTFLELTFKDKPTQIDKNSDGIVIQNQIEINEETLNDMLSNSLINWKLISKEKTKEISGNSLGESELIALHKEIKYKIIALKNYA